MGDADLAVLVERYEDGLTVREIAAEQGLAKTTVQDALARSGVATHGSRRQQNDDKDMNFPPGVVDLSALKPYEDAFVTAAHKHLEDMIRLRRLLRRA